MGCGLCYFSSFRFESCWNEIKEALGISGILTRICCWTSKAEDGHKGAQIDLVIDRSDQTVNLCEMKFSRGEYEITKVDDESFDNKIEAFLQQTKTKKSLMLTMVTSFGVKKNKYGGRIQQQVTMNDLFRM